MAAQGLVVRTQDGATYFIRDEILAATKVADEEAAVTEAMIAESTDVAAFSLNFAQPVQVGTPRLEAELNFKPVAQNAAQLGEKIKQGMSTVMCCW